MFMTQAEAELDALRLENERLHEQLSAATDLNRTICGWANRLEARVVTLAARTERLLRLAKYWRAPGKKPLLTRRQKTRMMIRYVELGGRNRGHGKRAIYLVANEFGVSESVVERCIREYKTKTVLVRKPSFEMTDKR